MFLKRKLSVRVALVHLTPCLELFPSSQTQAANLLDNADALDDFVWRARLEDDKKHAWVLKEVKGPAGESRD